MEFESIKRIFKPEFPIPESEIVIKKEPVNKKVKKTLKQKPTVLKTNPVQSSPLSKISNKYELFQYVKKL